ncbi:hypothetical protein Syun_007554 [Stephania yunnanensis]|uniref:Alpha/beta hydrolase fold-3 domain-containing protein n=1 Tax=Stephania yunnanensis TaxID=152371 RepID=A0AAP0PYU0_9MAGN
MGTTNDEIALELLPFLCVYKSGRVERLFGSPTVPPSPEGDPQTGVSSKDIDISSPSISARLYLPTTASTTATPTQKLPLLLYFRGSAFCIESAFSFIHQRYISLLSARASALIVSIEYRIAPEHPLPAAYHDSWEALLWLLSHSPQEQGSLTNSSNADHPQQLDQWILDHADFDRFFTGGDSAGANIVHNVAMRARSAGLTSRIRGMFLSQPYFWGSTRIGFEAGRPDVDLISRIWVFVSGGAGLDDPNINPLAEEAPSLGGLGCSKFVLVCVAGDDTLKERGKAYYEELKKSGWDGEVDLFEVEGEKHGFHGLDPECENSKLMIGRLASFLNQ